MLTVPEIRDHLADRRYLPGWEFTVYDGVWEGPHLTICAVLPDAYNRGETVVVRVENMLPPFDTRAQLDRWMVWRLARIASHEVREFYQHHGGRPVFDPHADYAERDQP